MHRRRNILNRHIRDFLKEDIKLNIGCGDKKLEGFVNIDIVPTEGTDVVMDVSSDLYLIPADIALEVRMESVFEHFYRYDQPAILQHCHRILKTGGALVINWLPDFDAIIDAYLKREKGIVGDEFDLFNVYRHTHGDPVPKNSPHQLHKDIFSRDSIKSLLEDCGFYIKKLERGVFPGERLALGINIIAIKK